MMMFGILQRYSALVDEVIRHDQLKKTLMKKTSDFCNTTLMIATTTTTTTTTITTTSTTPQ